jgi:hypothetical protein
VWQALFCVQIRRQTEAGIEVATFVPLVAGYKFKETGSHVGYKTYLNPATEPVLFILSENVCLHRVTTGFELQEESDEAQVELLASHINPTELVVIATDDSIPSLNSFNYPQAERNAQVKIPAPKKYSLIFFWVRMR